MLQTWLTFVLRWFPYAATGLLVTILVWRRLWRQLPFFLLYLSAGLGLGLLVVASFHFGGRQYFYVYWITNLVVSVIAFFPMYEVFLRRMFSTFQKTLFYRFTFPLVGSAILLLTILIVLQSRDRGAAFQMASRGFDFMRTAVLTFFIGLIAFMGRGWKRYDLGITLGFAIQASVALANSAVKIQTHYRPTVFDTLELISFNVSCLIWLVTFSTKEKEGQQSDRFDHSTLRQARVWETMLKTLLTPRR